MLAPDYLSGAPSGLIDLFGELEEYIIRDIARRVAKTGAHYGYGTVADGQAAGVRRGAGRDRSRGRKNTKQV